MAITSTGVFCFGKPKSATSPLLDRAAPSSYEELSKEDRTDSESDEEDKKLDASCCCIS